MRNFFLVIIWKMGACFIIMHKVKHILAGQMFVHVQQQGE